MMPCDEFAAAFGVWDEALPFLDIIFDRPEMQLVVAMQGRPTAPAEAAELLGMPCHEAAALMHRAYARCILNKEEAGEVERYSTADFSARLDHFAKYENWDDLPAEDRRSIDRRFLDEFIAKHRTSVERKVLGLEAENALPNDTVMLLSEVEEMIDAATHVVVQPCDCRRLGQRCDLPVETCLWLDAGALDALDRGHGRRLTREEAKELLRWADKKGLMHTADSDWQTRGLHAICNCCACDCYPFRAAQELGSKGTWPRSRYVAVHDAQRCNLCGACVKRCHFAAFYLDGTTREVSGRVRENVLLNAERCWGCGLCANTCPSQAIEMVPCP